jgi:hypothetical protein
MLGPNGQPDNQARVAQRWRMKQVVKHPMKHETRPRACFMATIANAPMKHAKPLRITMSAFTKTEQTTLAPLIAALYFKNDLDAFIATGAREAAQ